MPITPQSPCCIAAERPATTAQLTGLNLEIVRIQAGTRLCCISALDRNVSGSSTRLTAPISVSRWQTATDRFGQAVADTLGLNRTDMRCLDVLDREGLITAGRLAEATGLTSGAMTAALDRLEKAGFLRRVRDSGDRRRVLVELDYAVGERARGLYDEHARRSEELYVRYSESQLVMLLEFVKQGREFNEQQAVRLETANRAR